MTRFQEGLLVGVFVGTIWGPVVILGRLREIRRKAERVNAIEGLLINWKRECDRRCGQ